MATNQIDIRRSAVIGQAMYMSVKIGDTYSASMYRHTKKMDVLMDTPIKCLDNGVGRNSRGDYSCTMGDEFITPAGKVVRCMMALDRSDVLGDCMCVFWEIGSYDIIEKYYPIFAYSCRCLALSLGMKVTSVAVWPSAYGKVLEVRVFHCIDRGVVLPLNRLSFL